MNKPAMVILLLSMMAGCADTKPVEHHVGKVVSIGRIQGNLTCPSMTEIKTTSASIVVLGMHPVEVGADAYVQTRSYTSTTYLRVGNQTYEVRLH